MILLTYDRFVRFIHIIAIYCMLYFTERHMDPESFKTYVHSDRERVRFMKNEWKRVGAGYESCLIRAITHENFWKINYMNQSPNNFVTL